MFATFNMNDGSSALFNSVYAGLDESSLQFVGFFIIGGKCDRQAYTGTLTRQ